MWSTGVNIHPSAGVSNGRRALRIPRGHWRGNHRQCYWKTGQLSEGLSTETAWVKPQGDECKPVTAINFDGIDDYVIDTALPSMVLVVPNHRLISCWVYAVASVPRGSAHRYLQPPRLFTMYKYH